MNHAAARRKPARSRVSRRMCESVTNPTAAGEIWDAHQRSVSRLAAHRPANRRATAPAIAAISRRPRRFTALDAHALFGEPASHLAAVGVERSRLGGLETEHQNGLGVRG